MKRAAAALVVALAALLPAPLATAARAQATPAADVVRSWNAEALAAVRTTAASDAQAARTYAMVNAAVFDAVNGLQRPSDRRTHAIVAPTSGLSGDAARAAAGAAHDVLASLYPGRTAIFDDHLASDMSAADSPGQASKGRAWGGRVASAVLAARADDGSSPNESQDGGSGPGVFRERWSGTQFRHLAPFAIEKPSQYLTGGPPALTSAAYAAAWNEVRGVGDAAIPDSAALATYRFWAFGGGTSQPAGAWLKVADSVSVSQRLSLPNTARLFALMSLALADTVAPSYATKYEYRAWRPTTAIREADTDGNDDTTADPTWSPRAGTVGSSPEHASGHSSFSGAAATVLAGFFCRDDIAFALTSEGSSMPTRTYTGFDAAAAEAGRSRVLGGLHFEFSNQAGLTLGRGVADEVLAHRLLRTDGPTHAGDGCPR
ncbi:MAG: hypothetical protein QOH68_1075 [Nocardioidaceae bacterium]|jgi:hypothetical protein|nr:hypothetical protein [Nocardioidaceae bacterium]